MFYNIGWWLDIMETLNTVGVAIYDVLTYEFNVFGIGTFNILEASITVGLVTFLVLRFIKWFVPLG